MPQNEGMMLGRLIQKAEQNGISLRVYQGSLIGFGLNSIIDRSL
ncbi:MAG: hypothetical protein ACJAVT_002259 [Yoonia sp.]|jgi:hypothetical protein